MAEPDESHGRAPVRVRAAGVNFLDILIRRGRSPQLPELPAILGSETPAELGDGTRVMAIATGGYAARAAVEPAQTMLLLGASFAGGPAFLLTFLTAYLPLTRQVRLRQGASVLVTAAAGGVGAATTQVARSLGLHLIAVAGSEEKLESARELGAHDAFTDDAIPEELRVDVVIDPVEAPCSGAAWHGWGARHAGCVSASPGRVARAPARPPRQAQGRSPASTSAGCCATSPSWPARPSRSRSAAGQTGAVRPVVGAQFRLAKVVLLP
ncbi:MAG: zinc-binding dehydrogenase [Gaiellaceae bacterium]